MVNVNNEVTVIVSYVSNQPQRHIHDITLNMSSCFEIIRNAFKVKNTDIGATSLKLFSYL